MNAATEFKTTKQSRDSYTVRSLRPHYEDDHREDEHDEHRSPPVELRDAAVGRGDDAWQGDVSHSERSHQRDEHIEDRVKVESARRFLTSYAIVIGFGLITIALGFAAPRVALYGAFLTVGAFSQWLFSTGSSPRR